MSTRYASFTDWFASPLGQYLHAREQAYFDQLVADLFGFNAIQIGLPHWDMLRNSRIPHRFRIDAENAVDVLAEPTHLPVAHQSVDLLVLPHLLEFSNYPHQILREAVRVLIAEGNLLISGFNPRSLWGVHGRYMHNGGDYPWRGNFIKLNRLKDWLSLLGFEIVGVRMCCYAPPLRNVGLMRYFEFMETAGDRWWAMGGGVYFIHAVKRVHGMRLITPRWEGPSTVVRGLSPATRRQQNES